MKNSVQSIIISVLENFLKQSGILVSISSFFTAVAQEELCVSSFHQLAKSPSLGECASRHFALSSHV